MDFRYSFERWMEYIHPTALSNNVEYYNNYTTGMIITQYDQVGVEGIISDRYKKTLTYNIYDAFPINVNQLTGSWSDDGFHKLQVSFAYQRHTITQEKAPGFESRIPPVEDTSSTTGGINPQLRR
jgi:hypothetical protein